MSEKVIYLDNNATTMVAPEVKEAMLPYLCDHYGNPSSMHSFGGNVGRAVDHAREQVAALFGCQPTEVVFTSCGTESDNAAILSALLSNPEKKHIVTSRVEHPAVRTLGITLKKRGYAVTELPVDKDGLLDLEHLKRAIHPDQTAVVSLMAANNETGVLFPVQEAAAICKEKGVLFHTDAVQVAGKIPMNFSGSDSTIDMAAISGHKFHAPKGVGALYVKRGTRFRPFMIGGHQERGRRGGTENVPGIVALGVASELAISGLEEENTRVRKLRDKLEAGLLASCPDAILNGDKDQRTPNTVNISFQYVEGEAILLMMNDLGICASSGSACTSGSLEPSHVMRAMGVPFTAAHGSTRFSLSRYTTEEEIDYVLEHMPKIITRLREISPFGHGDAGHLDYGMGLSKD